MDAIGTSITVRTGVYKSTLKAFVVSETISEYRTLFTHRINGFRSRHHPITRQTAIRPQSAKPVAVPSHQSDRSEPRFLNLVLQP